MPLARAGQNPVGLGGDFAKHWWGALVVGVAASRFLQTGTADARSVRTSAPRGELDLLATVAHELRGPLSALTTSSSLLAADFDGFDDGERRRLVTTIHRRALWVQGLIENLFSAATIQQGRLSIAPTRLRLAEVVDDVATLLEPLLQHRGQILRVAVAQGLPDVRADRRRIAQVVSNLVSNASKFAPPDEPIDLSLKKRGEYVRLAVADRGPGFPAASEDRLFQAFYRAPATRVRADGAGLGLAIVKFIVDAHGGRVGAANRRGKGALFWFDLPSLATTNAARDTEGGK